MLILFESCYNIEKSFQIKENIFEGNCHYLEEFSGYLEEFNN